MDGAGAPHFFILIGLFLAGFASCAKSAGVAGVATSNSSSAAPGTATNITVSWNANHEKAVNSAGGGYKVYYSTTSGFALGAATLINVPYVAGPTAPTTTTISSLAGGTYYFKIVAYSALVPPAGGTAASVPTSQFSISLP